MAFQMQRRQRQRDQRHQRDNHHDQAEPQGHRDDQAAPAPCEPYSFNLLNRVFWLMPRISAARVLLCLVCLRVSVSISARLRLFDGVADRHAQLATFGRERGSGECAPRTRGQMRYLNGPFHQP